MWTTQDILQFHFSPTTLQQSIKNLIPITLNQQNDLRIERLHGISDKIGPGPEPPKILIPQVFRKLKHAYNNRYYTFERRELRALTYSLNYSEYNLSSIFDNENELKYALTLLESNWRDSFFMGLIDCFLSNWETKHIKSLEQIESIITRRLNNYTGNRNTLNSFKNNKRFFNIKNGDMVLGDTIARLNKPLTEATKILGVPEKWFSYPYFSKVIVVYYERNRHDINNQINTIEEVLNIHTCTETKKRLIPRIVIQATEAEFHTIKDRAKKMALTHLKDPQNKGESLWSAYVGNLSDSEINNINKAKQIILQWMAEEFINFFFKDCINDPRRRRFWLKYSNQISLFKIVGTEAVKKMLLTNQLISKYVDARFATTPSFRDSNSALMFEIKNYLFVEFSDFGAFYAYKRTNPNAPSMEKKYFNHTSELKDSSMNWLAYRSRREILQTSEEGKLGHNDGELTWEQVVSYWLRNVAGIQ